MLKNSTGEAIGGMSLVEPTDGPPIPKVRLPEELYWVLKSPIPLAGMRFPPCEFPWTALNATGFSALVSLHPGSYDCKPLNVVFREKLEDLVGGGPPPNDAKERARVRQAVGATLRAWRGGRGVVVHCQGGRGRTGTVLGCVLRELGFGAVETLAYLDRVHKARGKPGWPESPWQSALVKGWSPV